MLIFEKRASTILYKILLTMPKDRYFLLPANVCPIVVAIFLKAGIRYEFIDISENTLCIDEMTVLKRLKNATERYSGILFVRTYGISRNCESFFCAIKKISEQLLVIDDKCLSAPRFEQIKSPCVDVELFSTGATKYASIGWGGYAYADDYLPYCNNALRQFDPHKLDVLLGDIKICLQEKTMLSGYDTDWLDGAVPTMTFCDYMDKVLRETDYIKPHKETLNKIYRSNLPLHVQLQPGFHDWRFIIVVPERNVLLKEIFKQGLFAGTNYPSLSNIFGNTTARIADTLHNKVLNLFNDACISVEQAYRMVKIINAHLDKFA